MDVNGIPALIIVLALTVGLLFRQLMKWRDSESTSRSEDNEALRRDSESTSKTDDVSGEGNEALNTSGTEYQVFLSFRGKDTRRTITDCLYRGLRRFGVHVFLDDKALRVGKEIGGELLKALDQSQIYIPIFSQNYATSSWCLQEVEYMEKCTSKSDGNKEILPIFYGVDPGDVKLKTGSYRDHIAKHRMKFGLDELKRWEAALVKVAHLKGFELNGKGLGELADLVVEEVLCKLNFRNVDVPKYLVPDHAQIEAIIKELEVGSDGVRFLCIYGIGGIGKTTLARVVFNRLSHFFEGASFIKDVGNSSKHGLMDLQKYLLSKVVGSVFTNQIQDLEDGKRWIKNACNAKKVLIVIDDLNTEEQLKSLAGGSDWFGSGSRIIITTQNKRILMPQVELSGEEDQNQTKGILFYGVHSMEFAEAHQLFCKHAFKRDSPVDGFGDLARKIVIKVGMLPLAVEVIGSTLHSEGLDLNKRLDKIELWEETLKRLGDGPCQKVQSTLMISYNLLERDHRKVFLDIACLFINEDQTYPKIMWHDCNYYPRQAIIDLQHRSLIKIGDDNEFLMHDQVRDLGRYIILNEYPSKENPHKFSRVWKNEDAAKLLKMKEKNPNVEALSLTSNCFSHNFASKELADLPNLRLLRVKKSTFCDKFNSILSELRWLSWQTQQTTFDENNFHFDNLVVLDLSNSNIGDDWGGWSQMKMNRLKVLDLTGCRQLKMTPNLSNFVSLEMLILAQCVELTTIDSSINQLTQLITLNIKGCSSLGELPKQIGSLQKLTEIVMPQNSQSLKLPETFGNLKSLSSLILDKHPEINQLPESIGGLKNITRLSLHECTKIEELPNSIGELQMLVELDVSKSGLLKLPDSIGYLKKLEVIWISSTRIKNFPRTIGQVEMLRELHAGHCKNLKHENLEEIGKLSHLRILDLLDTRVSRFPPMLSCLSGLQTLKLGSRHLHKVPNLPPNLTFLHLQAPRLASILDLSSLINLNVLELSRLNLSAKKADPPRPTVLPETPLIHMFPSSLSTLKCERITLLPPFSNCKNLSVVRLIAYAMPHFSISQGLIHLKELELSHCKFLEEIPGLSLLKNLHRLKLEELPSLVGIHDLSELESLLDLRISNCHKIESLPNLSKLDKLQSIEVVRCPQITTIEGLEGLENCKLSDGGNVLTRSQSGGGWMQFPLSIDLVVSEEFVQFVTS